MNDTDPTARLRLALRREAERPEAPGFGLDRIRSHARRVRRARRARTAVVACALVAAVVVPTTLVLNHDPQAGPVPPAGTGTPSPSASPNPTPDQTRLRLASVPEGDPPGIGYLAGSTVHWPDGGSTRLPRGGSWSAVTPYHGGILATTPGGGETPTRTRLFDSSGAVVETHPGSSWPAVDDEGMRTAWWWADAADGTGHLEVGITSGMGEGEQSLATPPGVVVLPTGFDGDRVVYESHGHGRDGVFVTDLTGPGDQLKGLSSAGGVDATRHRVSGQRDDDPGVGAVVDARTGEEIWHADGWHLGQFSSDGTYLVATPSTANGDVPEIAVLDAGDGTVLARTPLVTNRLYLDGTPTWDGDSVLFVVTEGATTRHAVLRLDTTGALTRATPVRESPDGATGYLLTTQP